MSDAFLPTTGVSYNTQTLQQNQQGAQRCDGPETHPSGRIHVTQLTASLVNPTLFTTCGHEVTTGELEGQQVLCVAYSWPSNAHPPHSLSMPFDASCMLLPVGYGYSSDHLLHLVLRWQPPLSDATSRRRPEAITRYLLHIAEALRFRLRFFRESVATQSDFVMSWDQQSNDSRVVMLPFGVQGLYDRTDSAPVQLKAVAVAAGVPDPTFASLPYGLKAQEDVCVITAMSHYFGRVHRGPPGLAAQCSNLQHAFMRLTVEQVFVRLQEESMSSASAQSSSDEDAASSTSNGSTFSCEADQDAPCEAIPGLHPKDAESPTPRVTPPEKAVQPPRWEGLHRVNQRLSLMRSWQHFEPLRSPLVVTPHQCSSNNSTVIIPEHKVGPFPALRFGDSTTVLLTGRQSALDELHNQMLREQPHFVVDGEEEPRLVFTVFAEGETIKPRFDSTAADIHGDLWMTRAVVILHDLDWPKIGNALGILHRCVAGLASPSLVIVMMVCDNEKDKEEAAQRLPSAPRFDVTQ